MAKIKGGKSNDKYDADLKKIAHFQIHPEMIPYVGEYYEKGKSVLLVGESHYVDELTDASPCWNYYKKEWYAKKLPNDFPNQRWFTTRRVISNFLVMRRSRSHSMFSNPAKAAAKAWNLSNVTDSDVFSTFAFMNYFQKPASIFGSTFQNTNVDNDMAYKAFREVCDALQPKLVVFLSKKASKAFWSTHKEKTFSYDTVAVAHPTCSHWRKTGEQEFIDKIQSFKPQEALPQIRKPEKKQLCDQMKLHAPKYKWTEKRQFEKDVLFRLYGENAVYEIVFYKRINGRRIGIGYRFDYCYIWVWDYDRKDYLDPAEGEDPYPNNADLRAFYNEVCDVICKLFHK